ncbi:MAG: YdcF family protein [Clostridia bacterium]
MEITKEMSSMLSRIWDYTGLNMPLEESDLIIGCGCANLEIPVKCSLLWKQGYAKNILFTGGLGKITKDTFTKPEAQIFQDIAIAQGVPKENVFLETQSTNTGDNFRMSIKIIETLEAKKILIVHNRLSERRTFCTAKKVLPDKEWRITSPDLTFKEWIQKLQTMPEERAKRIMEVMVGDLQRMMIFPQFGWQIQQTLPEEVVQAYQYLKQLGYTKYIFFKDQIDELIKQFGLEEQTEPFYWY